MTTLAKSLFTLCLVAFSFLSFAQFDKVEFAIEDGNYKRVEKLTASYMENPDMKKLPETYFYHALALYELSKDPVYFAKNPDAVKDAVKAVKKGKKKDKDSTVIFDFEDMIDGLATRQNEVALAQYNINKMSKASAMFDASYLLNGNRYAYMMSAKSALTYEDSAKCEKHYSDLIEWYNEDHKNNVEETKLEIDPHVYFINKYWVQGKYDSAKFLITNGRELFGNHAKLNFYQKAVTMDQIRSLPPSDLLLEYVQDVIQYMPADKELLHKENSIYIFLIKNKLNNALNLDSLQDTGEANDLISKFVSEKVARSSHKQATKIKATDVFVEKKAENVLWKLAEYFQTYHHNISAEYVLNKYINNTAKSDTAPEIAARWGVISDYAYKTKGLPFSIFILKQAIKRYPENKELIDLRRKIISEKEVVRTNVDEQGALYSLAKDEMGETTVFEEIERIVAINDKYLGLLIAANRFATANEVMNEQMEFAPELDHSERLQFIAKEDFYHNYFLTKTKGKDESGEVVDAYQWNGSLSKCEAGEIDEDIQTKVANRINYFRRNAGVPEVIFDPAVNEYCQQAALMMTANRKMEHEPPRTWRCYSDDGAYAAKHSLLIKDANTSLAVTYIMDDKNPSAGNRRWLLYPNGKVYGHGSTNNVAVIWALDDSGSTDTSMYLDNPICWPPKGDVPQIMLFDNWTFSIYRDLDSATVEVTQDGKALDVKVEKVVEGYGAPTLVFKPGYEKSALPPKSHFDVTVTLSDGSQYSYSVSTFYYDPNKS
jgi:uncharacterized protein YkwD